MNKQIDDMSDTITKICENKRFIGSYTIAENLYNAGYRLGKIIYAVGKAVRNRKE